MAALTLKKEMTIETKKMAGMIRPQVGKNCTVRGS
jgi:hypothetical protein